MYVINHQLTENPMIQLDSGFYFGQGAFETILMLERPVFLEQHVDRLNITLEKLGIQRYMTKAQIEADIALLGVKNQAIKIAVSDQNCILSHRAIPYKEEDYKHGAQLSLSTLTRDSKAISSGIKSFNYIDLIVENKTAKSKGYMDSVLINEQRNLVETCFSNLFLIMNGEIATPKLSSGLLPGIVRDWVIHNFDVIETDLKTAHLIQCEGAFITNSLMGIMPVYGFEGHIIGEQALIETIQMAYKDVLRTYKNGSI